jgi:hypothetical protein
VPALQCLLAGPRRRVRVLRLRSSATQHVTEKPGELDRILAQRQEAARQDERQSFFSQLIGIAEMRGYKRGWAFHKYREKFGVDPKGLSEPMEPTDGAAVGALAADRMGERAQETGGGRGMTFLEFCLTARRVPHARCPPRAAGCACRPRTSPSSATARYKFMGDVGLRAELGDTMTEAATWHAEGASKAVRAQVQRMANQARKKPA